MKRHIQPFTMSKALLQTLPSAADWLCMQHVDTSQSTIESGCQPIASNMLKSFIIHIYSQHCSIPEHWENEKNQVRTIDSTRHRITRGGGRIGKRIAVLYILALTTKKY
jgi:hypothetical protein